MKRQWRSILILLVLIFSTYIHDLAMSKKAVAWIVGGYKDCIITRFENGKFMDYEAKPDMPLFPGDRIYKKKHIKSVMFEYLPYYEPWVKDSHTAVIISRAPTDKESILSKFADWFGIARTKYMKITGIMRCIPGQVPLENSTIITHQDINVSRFFKTKSIVFKELREEEGFRKSTRKTSELLPGEVGLVQDRSYIMRFKVGETHNFQFLIRVPDKKNEEMVQKAFRQIELENPREYDNTVKKAAYLQFVSDIYHEQIDLYWLSYYMINSNITKLREVKDIYMINVLLGRCFEHFKGGISETDFAILKVPGCLVSIKLKRNGEMRFVAPDIPFYNGDTFRCHFQTNFKGYALILYEDEEKSNYNIVFPKKSMESLIMPKMDRYTQEYELYDGPCEENLIFIFSINPIIETEKLHRILKKRGWEKIKQSDETILKLQTGIVRRAQKEGKKLKVKSLGTKAYVTTMKGNLNGIVWFRLSLKNIGRN